MGHYTHVTIVRVFLYRMNALQVVKPTTHYYLQAHNYNC